MHIVGPAGYAWADQRAKELARNTKPHYQHGTVKHPNGSLFADPYTRTGHDTKQKSTEKQALIKQWAHVDSTDSFKKRDQKTYNSGLLVQVYVCDVFLCGQLLGFSISGYTVPFHLLFLWYFWFSKLHWLIYSFGNWNDFFRTLKIGVIRWSTQAQYCRSHNW